MNLTYASYESNFTLSSFDSSYSSKVSIYFDNVSFTLWVSIISLVLLKHLVNAAKDSFLSCFMLTKILIALNIDAIGYEMS